MNKKKDFFRELFIEADADFSKIAQEIIEQTQKLVGIKTLQRLLQIANLLKVLSLRYNKKDFLILPNVIIQHGPLLFTTYQFRQILISDDRIAHKINANEKIINIYLENTELLN